QGVATYISFCNEYKTAVVVLTNISNHSAVSSIKQLLFQFSEQGIHLNGSDFSDANGGDGDGLLGQGEIIEMTVSILYI
ncbi:MAG: hypothetical protein ABIE07_01740, partial [Candidatus Zixiibacteriota bacterium]